jgi:uncharacterized membrane protein YfcA
MSPADIAFLAGAAFFTSALTAVVGAGGGTALIAVMLQVMLQLPPFRCMGPCSLRPTSGA